MQTLKSFVKNVAASITPEPLSANRLASSFIKIKARNDNTGIVYIGGADAQEYALSSGQELALDFVLEKTGGSAVLDLHKIYCKVATNGDGVYVIYSIKS